MEDPDDGTAGVILEDNSIYDTDINIDLSSEGYFVKSVLFYVDPGQNITLSINRDTENYVGYVDQEERGLLDFTETHNFTIEGETLKIEGLSLDFSSSTWIVFSAGYNTEMKQWGFIITTWPLRNSNQVLFYPVSNFHYKPITSLILSSSQDIHCSHRNYLDLSAHMKFVSFEETGDNQDWDDSGDTDWFGIAWNLIDILVTVIPPLIFWFTKFLVTHGPLFVGYTELFILAYSAYQASGRNPADAIAYFFKSIIRYNRALIEFILGVLGKIGDLIIGIINLIIPF